MSKVITYSRYFPAGHPRKAEPTDFVQKIWLSLIDCGLISTSKAVELSRETGIGDFNMDNIRKCPLEPKHHTIRSGNRWKVGDIFSPRVWNNDINPKSGRSGPYHSQQIAIAPDIEIKKVWNFEVDACGVISIDEQYFFDYDAEPSLEPCEKEVTLARNDGLAWEDFTNWLVMPCFRAAKPWNGQIICWNEHINY